MDLHRTTEIAKAVCSAKTDWSDPTFIRAGNSAAVFRVNHKLHGRVALKVYDPAFFIGENALIEARRIKLQDELSSHGNANLIEVLEVGELQEYGTWYILMEYCPWPMLDECLSQIQ